MKKTPLIAIVLLCLTTVFSNAGTVLEQDFTQVSSMPEGWTSGQWNGENTPHYTFGENGAIVNHPWKQNYLQYDLTGREIASTAPNGYVITFTTYATTTDQQSLFYLGSGSCSIVIGNSYNSNAYVSVGKVDHAVSGFLSFQDGDNRTLLTPIGTTSQASSLNVGTALNYTLTLNSGELLLSVTDGTNTFQSTYDIPADFSFDKIGFINDGSNTTTGVQSIRVIPEPAVASLSLLGLAALSLRRRRK